MRRSSTSKTSMPAGCPGSACNGERSGIQNRRFSPSTINRRSLNQPGITLSTPKVAGPPRTTELSTHLPICRPACVMHRDAVGQARMPRARSPAAAPVVESPDGGFVSEPDGVLSRHRAALESSGRDQAERHQNIQVRPGPSGQRSIRMMHVRAREPPANSAVHHAFDGDSNGSARCRIARDTSCAFSRDPPCTQLFRICGTPSGSWAAHPGSRSRRWQR